MRKGKTTEDILLTKFYKYLNKHPKDLQARKKLNITKNDFRNFFIKAICNPDLSSFYDQCRIIEWADFIHENFRVFHIDGKQLVLRADFQAPPGSFVKEITIPLARYQISRTETKTEDFKKPLYEIKETKIFRYWPMMIITARDIIKKTERIIEAELLFPVEKPSFDVISWQEYAVELLQMFQNNPEWVFRPLFLPYSKERFVLIYKGITGKEIKRYEFPIYQKYKGMITNLLKGCWLTNTYREDNRQDSEDEAPYKKHYKEDERQVALTGFYDAVMSYKKNLSNPLPVHLKLETHASLSNTFKNKDYSTEELNKERLQQIRRELQNTDEKDLQTYIDKHFKKRILKEELESSGGSLDDPINEDGDTLKDIIPEGCLKDMYEGFHLKPEDKVIDEVFISELLQKNPKLKDILDKQEKGKALTPSERKSYERIVKKTKKEHNLI